MKPDYPLVVVRLVLIDQAASEKMSIKSVNNVGADSAEAHGGLTNAYPINSPGAFGSGELKSKQITVNLLSHDTSFGLLSLVMEFHKKYFTPLKTHFGLHNTLMARSR